MSDEAQTSSSWIKSGTEEAEPVTTETPATEEVVEATTEETTETVEATEEIAAVEEAVEEVVQQFIDAKLGDEKYELPEGVLVPQTRDGETTYVPIQEVLDGAMRGNDYRIKTTELAQGRRTLERSNEDLLTKQARLDAKIAHMDEREAEMKAALTDPKSALAYQEHLNQYATNPIYRKNVDAGLAQQETEAELAAVQGREDARIVSEASQRAFDWIEELQAEYPSVDPERVRLQYSTQLKLGEAQLDISAVRSIYEAETAHVNRTLSPLEGKLAEITAQLKALQDGVAATEHNEQTEHAVKRAKTTPVATGKGAPTTVPTSAPKFGPNELQHKTSEWVRAGRA